MQFTQMASGDTTEDEVAVNENNQGLGSLKNLGVVVRLKVKKKKSRNNMRSWRDVKTAERI